MTDVARAGPAAARTTSHSGTAAGADLRTLVIAPNWIGDAVMAQPLIALLARFDPRGRIDAVAPPHIAPVMRAMPGIGEVVEMPNRHGSLQWRERWQLARKLRARGYERCVVLPNSFKSALAPWLAGIASRVGYRGEARYGLLNTVHVPAPGDTRPPMVEFYAALAFEPGHRLPGPLPDPVLAHDPGREAAVLARLGIARDARLVVLAPGAEYGPAKQWPARHFAALAARLVADSPAVVVAVVGSSKERALATEIVALSGLACRNLAGETSIDEALALIARADGVVSNDSGLMHVAAAYRRPQVAVFGSSDPRHTPPRSPRARVQWLHLPCSPCFARKCPLGHTDCLNGIAPDTVHAALAGAMRREGPTAAGR